MKERNEVVLVDMADRVKGREDKMEAHVRGFLHRAFSVFIFRGDRILLQRRAVSKYHCGGLWTNTCCSHPGLGEDIEEAARERLYREMGIRADRLEEIHAFVYRAEFPNGLIEYEYDHVFVGESGDEPVPHPCEVEDWRWIRIEDLMKEVEEQPELFTPWFITALKPVADYLRLSC